MNKQLNIAYARLPPPSDREPWEAGLPDSPLSAASPSPSGWPPRRPACALVHLHGFPGPNAARRFSRPCGLPPAGSPLPLPAPGRDFVSPCFCPPPPLAQNSLGAGGARQQLPPPVSSEHAGESEKRQEPQVQRRQSPCPVGLPPGPDELLLQAHRAPLVLGSVPC